MSIATFTVGPCAGCCPSCDDTCSHGTQYEWHSFSVIPAYFDVCHRDIIATHDVTNPYPGPALVCIRGNVDDILQVNGVDVGVVGPCADVAPFNACNCGFSGWTGTVAGGETLTLTLINVMPPFWGCNLYICFVP